MTEISEPEFNPARSIIDRFARDDRSGSAVLATLLSMSRPTVDYWIKAKSIPEKYRQQVIDAGARIGVLVTPFCFVAHLRAQDFTNAA